MLPLAPVMLAAVMSPTPVRVKERSSMLSVVVAPPGSAGAKAIWKPSDPTGAKVAGSGGAPLIVKLGFPRAILPTAAGTVEVLVIVKSTVLLLPITVRGNSKVPPGGSGVRSVPIVTPKESVGATPRPVRGTVRVTPPPAKERVALKGPKPIGLNRTSTLREAPAASGNGGVRTVKGLPPGIEPVTSAETLPLFESVTERVAD